MSVPFSNTHLRVPRGFGTILEGLAREVLRDQPEDIPKYAAQYFDALLAQREDSGMDPAEWAAKLEDRFYNNHAFKATGQASPEKEPATEVAISKEKSFESQTEDDSSHSAEASHLSTTQPNVSEEGDLTESTEEEEEEEEEEGGKYDITEKHIISMEKRFSEEESVTSLPAAEVQPDEVSGTEEENNPTITTFHQVDRVADEKDSSSIPDQNISQFELEPTEFLSFRGVLNVDVCAQELGTAEDEGHDKQETAFANEEIVDSEEEEKSEIEEPVEVFPYSGLADVNVCATELGGTERTTEGATAEDDRYVVEEETTIPQTEEAVARSASQSETHEGNQQEDQAEKTKEKEEGTEAGVSSGEMHESLAHVEGGFQSNALPKEDSLVEVSFEDVPEAQQIKEFEEKQPEEEDPAEVLQTKISEMQKEEESTAVATDQNISGPQDHNEPEMVKVGQEVDSEGEEMESQHEASDILKENVDTNISNLNDSDDDDDEKGDGVKNISSSHQPTTEADEENPDDETDHENEYNEKLSEGEFDQNESNEPDFKGEETTDAVRGDKEDIHTGGYSEVEDQEMIDGGAENHSSEATQSNISTAATEEKSETLEESVQLLPEEKERTLVVSQPADTMIEKAVTSKERTSEAEELVEEGKIVSEMQEKSDAMSGEGSISPIRSADLPDAYHQGEERPHGSEKDTREPEGNSGDKQEECSRPQEEEDIMDIPLDDPEANRAAAKIQAGFRGHMTRKKMKPEDKAEGEEVSSTGDVLNGSQGDTETGGSGAVEGDDTSVPEQ